MQVKPDTCEFDSAFGPRIGCAGMTGHHSRPPEETRELVYLIDPDPQSRHQLKQTLTNSRVDVATFASVAEYLYRPKDHLLGPACLIVDLPATDRQAPGSSDQLAREARLPVIFTCSEHDIHLAVRALKSGAIDLLIKPLDTCMLMDAVRIAFAQDIRLRKRRAELARLERNLATLTPREREVLPLVTGGLLNKQAASLLGISEVTLQIHRSQVMRKMQASSVADLVRMSSKLRLPYWHADEDQKSELAFSRSVSFHGGAAVPSAVALR